MKSKFKQNKSIQSNFVFFHSGHVGTYRVAIVGGEHEAVMHAVIVQVCSTRVIQPSWIRSLVTPICKGTGDQEHFNYHGITFLCVPGKVFAHPLLNRIRFYEHRNQFAFLCRLFCLISLSYSAN